MGPCIAGFTINRGQFFAAGFHGPMQLRETDWERPSAEPYGSPHRPPSAGVREEDPADAAAEIEVALRRAGEVSK